MSGAAPKGGRPRDPNAEQAILDATVAQLLEVGFGRLSVDAVAARAGVGKATIYRRWRSKDDLLHAAISRLDATGQVVDTGDLQSDLRTILRWLTAHFGNSNVADLMPLLVAEARFDAGLRAVQHSVAREGRGVVQQILELARRRGELRDDLDDEVVIDLLIAPIFLRKLLTGAPVTVAATDAAIELVVRAIAAP